MPLYKIKRHLFYYPLFSRCVSAAQRSLVRIYRFQLIFQFNDF